MTDAVLSVNVHDQIIKYQHDFVSCIIGLCMTSPRPCWTKQADVGLVLSKVCLEYQDGIPYTNILSKPCRQ